MLALKEQYETLGLLQKIKYFKDHGIEHGSPVHDDVPCKLYEDAKERITIGKALTKQIKDNVSGYEHVRVKSELFEMPEFTRKTPVRVSLQPSDVMLLRYCYGARTSGRSPCPGRGGDTARRRFTRLS